MQISRLSSTIGVLTTLACSAYTPGDPNHAVDVNGESAPAGAVLSTTRSNECRRPPTRLLQVETFNAALAPNFAPLVAERTPLVLAALAEQAKQLDVLCVQEFWQDTAFAQLAQRVHNELPHALRRPPRPGTGTCTLDELTSLGQCLGVNCSSAAGVDQVMCAQSQCSSIVASLSGGCLGCIMNNIGSDFAVCVGPGGPADPAIYSGAYDVGMLTRHELLEADVTQELDSYFVRMAVLYAKLEVPGGSPIHAFCTHLGSSLSIVPYAGKYASWQAEHLHQVEQLRDYIQRKAGNSGRVLLMGDMNAGPAGPGLVGEWSDNYAALLGDDLDDVYYHQPNLDCTWCPENTLVDDNSSPHLEDHILLRGFRPGAAHATRVLDQTIDLVESSATLATNLSDHFGLRCTMQMLTTVP